MKLKILVSISMLSGLACFALDLTTITGQTYSNVTVSKVESNALVLMGKKGVVKVPFAELSPEIQKKYNYDHSAEKPGPLAVLIRGKVLQVTDDGLIIRGVELLADDQEAARRRAGARRRYAGSFRGHDGRYYDSDLIVRIFADKGSYVDGADFKMLCTACGTYSYQNVNGSTSTIKAFKEAQLKVSE